ncbi:hypothetical protein ACHHYP_01169 [Achlya hypogyna]|uniref:Uncharacterized protein n=1 Tax=Achlya hypogyna TaxID=1202772 RepID=A0A1V9ZTM0_ACHHY|nr:hypothetical protein ACHHYP_01169 [Achlya hypogyna]
MPPRRKRDGVKPKPRKEYKKLNATSVEALLAHTKPKSKEEEAVLFATHKAQLSKARLHRAVYSVISEYHQTYIDWYPDHPKSYERQGYSQYHLGNYMKAIERLGQAIYLGANTGKVWRTLGKACFLLWKQTHSWGLLWDAKKCYEYGLRFLEIATSPFAMFELIQVLEGLGDFSTALGATRTLLFSFPQFKNVDHVIFHAVVLMFQRVVFQQAELPAAERTELLEQCCEYCKYIIDKDISKTELYIDVLYVTARVHEVLGIPRTLKYATKTYEELYRVALRQHVVTPIAGKSWSDWFRDESTWKTWVDYFDKRDCYILSVDATQEALKRITTRHWDARAFAWEPDASLWQQLGQCFYKCNAMVPAVAAVTTAYYFAHYRDDIRSTLVEWYPQQWSALFECEHKGQIIISSLLRGVWGRDKAQRQKAYVIAQAVANYNESPYTNLRARKTLLRYRKEKYAPKFAAQDLSARTLQRASHLWLAKLRSYYSHKANCDRRIQALEHKLSVTPYERLVRNELGALSPKFFALFRAQASAAVTIQKVHRGSKVRGHFRIWLCEKRAADAKDLRRTLAARTIQRRFRFIRSNAILRMRQVLRLKKERLAINLQRLYRRKHSLMVEFLRRRAENRANEARYQLHRRNCVRIQTWWRRQVAMWKDDGPMDEAQFLLDRLLRGHDTLMQEEKDLDFYARKIQALYRGRKDRVNLKGLKRKRVPPPPAITTEILDAMLEQGAGVVRDGMVVGQIRNLLQEYSGIVLEPHNPLQHKIFCANLVAALASGAAASVVKSIVVPHGCLLRGEGLSCLVEAMRSSQLNSVRILAIGANDISSVGDSPLREFAACLQTAHFHLTDLILEDNAIENSAARHLAMALGDYFFGRYGHLKRFVLARVGLTDGMCDALGEALSINTVLQRLELPGNKIHDPGAALLAAGLQGSRTLRLLDLSDNAIGSAGGIALFKSLPTNALKVLLLRNNNLKNDVMPRLRVVLSNVPDIECIDLRGNLIHTDHLHELLAIFPPQASDYIVPEEPLVKPEPSAFERAKARLVAPSLPRLPTKMNALQALRHEQRTRPLGGYRNAESRILKLPRLPSPSRASCGAKIELP